MSNRSINLNDTTYQYLLDVSLREPEQMLALRERTSSLEMARMQIAPEQGQFMGLLAQIVAASRPAGLGDPRFIEVGTFTGYSALAVTRAVPRARLTACDVSEEWTKLAREAWTDAGVADRIDLVLQPATQTIATLLAEGGAGTFDFAFIDADKTSYLDYYEGCLELLRPGGVIVIDNVLWSGTVADPSVDDDDTRALRAINQHVHADERVEISMIPVGDGLTIARKRG